MAVFSCKGLTQYLQAMQTIKEDRRVGVDLSFRDESGANTAMTFIRQSCEEEIAIFSPMRAKKPTWYQKYFPGLNQQWLFTITPTAGFYRKREFMKQPNMFQPVDVCLEVHVDSAKIRDFTAPPSSGK